MGQVGEDRGFEKTRRIRCRRNQGVELGITSKVVVEDENGTGDTVKVIKALHHNSRKVASFPFKKANSGVWKEIMGMDKECAKFGVNVYGSLNSKVGIGDKTMFWCDKWIVGGALRDQFPLLYQLAAEKRILIKICYKKINGGILGDWVWIREPGDDEEKAEMNQLNAILLQQVLRETGDRWSWKDVPGPGYTVKTVRGELSGNTDVNSEGSSFYWNKIATQKANMFVWRAAAGQIPKVAALEARGISVPNRNCTFCNYVVESADHTLLNCRCVAVIWQQLQYWMKIPPGQPYESIEELLLSVYGIEASLSRKRIIHAVFVLALWSIWKIRNKKRFEGGCMNEYKVVEEIKELAFDCIVNRSKFKEISWSEWRSFNIQM